jgi:two-component system sensor histidine kinase VicK
MTNTSDLLLSLAEHDAHACFVFNLNTSSFIYANPAFYAFFELTDQELSAELLVDLVHPDDVEALREKYSSMQPDVLSKFEFRLQLPDKESHLIRANLLMAIAPGEKGVITGYVTDLSAPSANDRHTEKTFIMSKDILNKFTHELAGVLASIQTYTLLLSRKTKHLNDDEINELIDSLNQLSKESVNLIRNYKIERVFGSFGEDAMNNKN